MELVRRLDVWGVLCWEDAPGVYRLTLRICPQNENGSMRKSKSSSFHTNIGIFAPRLGRIHPS